MQSLYAGPKLLYAGVEDAGRRDNKAGVYAAILYAPDAGINREYAGVQRHFRLYAGVQRHGKVRC